MKDINIDANTNYKSPEHLINRRKEQWEQYKDLDKDIEFRNQAIDYLMSDKGKQTFEEIKNNPEYLIEIFFVVVNKDSETIPFFLNDVQKLFIKDLNQAIADYRAGKRNHLKFLIVKGRQQGFTAVVSAYQLANNLVRRNFSGYTLADNADNSATIFEDKAKFTYENIPSKLKPKEKTNNKKELHFLKLNSKWRVATAGNKDTGRSKTIRFFHGSEVAFWPNIENTLTGLGEALTKDAITILETTVNGYNYYKRLCDEAKNGENNYELKFYQWFLTKEYRLDFESLDREAQFKYDVLNKKDWVFTECKWLLEFHKLDWNQLYWYYNKWRDRKEFVKQEYPNTIDQAFLASGRNVFDKEILIKHKEYLVKQYQENPPLRGFFTFKWNNPDAKDYILDDTIKFQPNPNGYISIYEDIKPNYPYVLGGDTKGEGKDKFSATIINNVTGKRCSVLHANLDADIYTHQVYCMGRYFNTALIGIEINFNTYPVDELQRLKYFKQYIREKPNTYTGELEKRYGWKTDVNTREPMIAKEISLIRDNIDLFTHIAMLDECLTFVYDKTNRPDAESGSHDDILFSDMICNEIRNQQSFETIVSKEPKKIHWAFQSDNVQEESYMNW